MKSTMEEASTIFKAIEQGWKRAGQPEEFSIKVLEFPESNFLGMNTKPAKIAFFFGAKEAVSGKKPYKPTAQPQRPAAEPSSCYEQTHQELKNQERAAAPAAKPAIRPERKPQERKIQEPKFADEHEDADERRDGTKTSPVWTPEMVQDTKEWLEQTVRLMNIALPAFESDVNRYYLRIKFSAPLIEDQEKERLVFSSFAHLIMQVLRQKNKKSLRGLKVVLNRA